jgi:putative transcriptional regulator
MSEYYDGKLLIAPPSMRDWRFAKSVVYIWKHDVSGAAGIIINKPLDAPTFREVCAEAECYPAEGINPTLFYGGPVIEGMVGCLHSLDYAIKDTVKSNSLNFTLDRKIIQDIAEGQGPNNYIITMGMANWDAGQLEQELESLPPRSKNESWLALDFDPNLIWQGTHPKLWNACLNMAVAQGSREYVSKFIKD